MPPTNTESIPLRDYLAAAAIQGGYVAKHINHDETPHWPQIVEDAYEFADTAVRLRDEAVAKMALASENIRVLDLLRYCRSDLHKVNLISDEEYSNLLTLENSVARLGTYDDLRKQIASLEQRLKELSVAEKFLAAVIEAGDAVKLRKGESRVAIHYGQRSWNSYGGVAVDMHKYHAETPAEVIKDALAALEDPFRAG